MRPKYILWLIVAALSLSWYLLDPEARRSGTADIPTTTSTAATIHLGEVRHQEGLLQGGRVNRDAGEGLQTQAQDPGVGGGRSVPRTLGPNLNI